MNPYEIRTELVKIATKHFSDLHDANMMLFHASIDILRQDKILAISDVQSLMPKFPTGEEIMAYADKLYQFVNNKPTDKDVAKWSQNTPEI